MEFFLGLIAHRMSISFWDVCVSQRSFFMNPKYEINQILMRIDRTYRQCQNPSSVKRIPRGSAVPPPPLGHRPYGHRRAVGGVGPGAFLGPEGAPGLIPPYAPPPIDPFRNPLS